MGKMGLKAVSIR